MEDETGRQLDFWGTLDGTRVVATAAGTTLEPWRAPTREEVAKAFGDAEATETKGRRPKGLDAKLPAGRTAGWGSQARIRPAKHGNAFVVTRRRD